MMDEKSQVFRTLGLLGSLGLTVAACIIGGFLGGHYADQALGTGGLLMVIGTLGGVAASFWLAYRWIMRQIR